MKNNAEIIICGDICPTDDTKHFFEKNDTNGLLGEVKTVLTNTDILIANLEFPLTDDCQKAMKTGPVLYGKTKYIDFFKTLGFTALGLANNHIKDCSENGVLSSLNICKDHGIETVGAGVNESEAKKPLIIERNGIKIGILAFAEHEFNAAYENEAGANLFDVYTDYEQIESLSKSVDYVIVMYHGGIEHYAYPSPLLQKRCRKMVDKGADYVVCQHSHIIGTEEEYNHGTILYGQGNTIYGYREDDPTWNEGLIVKIDLSMIDEKLKSSIHYIPIRATKPGIVFMTEIEQKEIKKMMKKRQKQIAQKDFIQQSWNIFCESKKTLYLPQLFGQGRIFNKLNRIFNNLPIKIMFTKEQHMITNNLIRCEAHNEVVQTILNNVEDK